MNVDVLCDESLTFSMEASKNSVHQSDQSVASVSVIEGHGTAEGTFH